MRDPRTDPQAGDVLRLPSGVVALVDGADDMEDDQEILNCLWRTITSPALGIGRLTDADLIAAMRKLCGVDGG